MLMEQLLKKAEDNQESEYDWDAYYRWLYSALAGRDATDMKFWICKNCLTVNVFFLPARYGKCRDCKLIYMA